MSNRLTRSYEDRMIGGVCAGIANFLGISPTIVRIIFCLSGGLNGLYLLLWILLPEDDEEDDEEDEHY